MAPMLVFPGVLPWVMWPQPLYPQVLRILWYLDSTCWALPSFCPHPLIGGGWGAEVESACLLVATTERLLHDMLASVDQNNLRTIWVSLKREENLARIPLASSTLSHPLACFVSAALVLRQRGRACIASGGNPSTGCSRHYLGGCYGVG
jgi:hypothetical protein